MSTGVIGEPGTRGARGQARAVARALGPASYGRFAIGGGTPTLLDEEALARV